MTTQVLAALPTPVDLRLYAGNDFTATLTVTDSSGTAISMVGYTVLAQVRDAAVGTLYATFASSIATNVITLSLTKAQTKAVTAPSLWDCTVTDPGGRATTLAAGDVSVESAVSA